MSRYWVFAGANYYASGGAYDLQSTTFDDMSDATEYAESKIGEVLDDTPRRYGGDRIEWAHVFDTVEKNVVFTTTSV